MIRKLFALSLAVLSCGFACSALAQTTVHYREGERVDPVEVARILGHESTSAIKTRSIRLLDEPAASTPSAVNVAFAAPVAKRPTRARVADDEPAGALSLPVRFEFGSADISPSARAQLNALAEGIKMLSSGQRILVEGHTDAVGSDEYNRELSQRRAAAVKQYLVTAHGIDQRRLIETGVGKEQPIEGLDPFAAQNRRVQFRGV